MTGVEAVQRTLAGAYAAEYVLGVGAAQTSRSADPEFWQRLLDARQAHQRAAVDLASRVRELGGDPVVAEPAYRLPNSMATRTQIQRAARVVEQRMARICSAHVAETVGGDRRLGIELLTGAAIRLLWFRGIPETLPGTTAADPPGIAPS